MQIVLILRKIVNTAHISMFSGHISIFRTLSIDIWPLKCQETINKKNGGFVYLQFAEFSKVSFSSF